MIIFSLSACSVQYSFKESADSIQSVEIVYAENRFDFTVIKKLLEEEQNVFLDKLQKLEFKKYLGYPPGVHGYSFIINYQSGNYEMICSFSAEYIENGEIRYRFMSCDSKAFDELFSYFTGDI